MPMRRHGGFTLLELLVAVAIFILLTALAVPGFQTYFEKSRVRGAADQVITLMATARQSAVKFDRSVSVQKCRYAAYQSHCFASRVCPSDPTMPSEKNPFEYRPIALPALTVNRTSSLPTVGTTPATLSAPPHDWSVTVGDLESARTCRSRPDTAIRPFEVSN